MLASSRTLRYAVQALSEVIFASLREPTDDARPHRRTCDRAAAPPLLRENLGPIAVLTLNRPQARNTLSEAMLAALSDELVAARR